MAPKAPLVYSIDDDLAFNKLIEARFLSQGCQIRTFTQPADLYHAIKERQPKLVLVDLNLGGQVSGFDVIDTIRNTLEEHFPILVVSSDIQPSSVAHALEIGATDYIVKSLYRLEFEEKLSEYLAPEGEGGRSFDALMPIPFSNQSARIGFNLALSEIHPMGFTFVSSHLIKKGAPFWISGDAINQITTKQSIQVTVFDSAIYSTTDKKLYHIKTSIDPSDEELVQDLKVFLDNSRRKTLV